MEKEKGIEREEGRSWQESDHDAKAGDSPFGNHLDSEASLDSFLSFRLTLRHSLRS